MQGSHTELFPLSDTAENGFMARPQRWLQTVTNCREKNFDCNAATPRLAPEIIRCFCGYAQLARLEAAPRDWRLSVLHQITVELSAVEICAWQGLIAHPVLASLSPSSYVLTLMPKCCSTGM